MAMTSNFQRNKDGSLKTVNGKQVPPHLVLLRIPPAWTEVMVDTNPTATSLAKGLDAAGRIQRVYVGSFLESNKMDKFKRIRQLLLEWDDIRTQIESDLNGGFKDREMADAANVVYLIYETAIRPGSEKDTKAAIRAYGATTLLSEHLVCGSDGVCLRFIGKKGVQQHILVTNSWLCGQLTSRHRTGGKLFNVRPSVLSKYMATIGSGIYTVKDLRTARATKLAIDLVSQSSLPVDKKERKLFLKQVMEKVAKKLGNTAQVAKTAYVDPDVVEEILK